MSPLLKALGVGMIALAAIALVAPAPVSAQCRTYTLDADFDMGLLVNVNHDVVHDQLQLNTLTTPFPFLWVALSGRGTIVRVDVNTGAVLGEYRTAPLGRGLNPSRTTVDLEGNVWTSNRDENGGGKGSVVKVGIVIGGTRVDSDGTPNPMGEYLAPPFVYSTAVDRDGDGLIKTSRGLGDVRSWPDVTDGVGGPTALVEDADDECILIYQRISGPNARHISVDPNNDVWVAGYPFAVTTFDKLDGATGTILTSFSPGCGGYGGLMDGNGVIWSSAVSQSMLLRYDVATATGTCIAVPSSYGLGIDGNGYIWNAMYASGQVMKFSPAGVPQPGFPKTTSGSATRGVAVTPADDHVWAANSGSGTVARLDNDGNLLKLIAVGATPTGVAVDANGKVWVTNYGSDNAMRIDPAAGPDGLGAVDLTVSLGAGASPYNYSDMTGLVALSQTAPQGTWTVVYDGGAAGMNWGTVSWNLEPCSMQPMGSSITARARSSADQVTWSAWETAMNGVDLAVVPDGRYLQVEMKLTPNAQGESPILCDVRVCTGVILANLDIHPTSCPNPINLKSKGVTPVALLGTADFDVFQVDPATIRLEGIPPVRWGLGDVSTPVTDPMAPCECNTLGEDGYDDLVLKFETQALAGVLALAADGDVVPLTLTAMLQNGRRVEATDCVRVLRKFPTEAAPILVDLTVPMPTAANPISHIEYSVPDRMRVNLSVIDVAGRVVDRLVDETLSAGNYVFDWNPRRLPSGMYFVRMRFADDVLVRRVVLSR